VAIQIQSKYYEFEIGNKALQQQQLANKRYLDQLE